MNYIISCIMLKYRMEGFSELDLFLDSDVSLYA